MEPTKQSEVPVTSVDGSNGARLGTDPSASSSALADRRICLWHVMGFTDLEVAAYLDVSVRDVHAAMERCRASANTERGAEDSR